MAYLLPMTPSWNSALRILSRRDHTRAELEKKLKLRKFETSEIQATLRQLESLGYLDDERVADARVRSYLRKGYAVSGAIQKARQLGLSDEVLKKTGKAVARSLSLSESDNRDHATEALMQFLNQKLRGKTDDKTITRVLRYYLARGHRIPELKRALEGLNLKWPKK